MNEVNDDNLIDWLYLNPEGRKRLLAQEEAVHACEGYLEWNWKAVPFNRVALMNLIASRRDDCRYLEIGCDKNELFHALPLTDKTGVDPVSGGNRRLTSDAFFAENTRQFDVIFIDGLHTYGQVRRDVVNALDALAPGGWIGLHDLLPRDWKEQHTPRVQGIWTGDVWKVAFELSKTPGLDFGIVQIDHGVGLVRKTGKATPQLIDLRDELEPQGFAYFRDNHQALPLIDWPEVCSWIATVYAPCPEEEST